jgi:hypothetical protein
MQNTCDQFRKRKEEDEKKKIAAQERDEFEQWKKRKEGKGFITPFPNIAGETVDPGPVNVGDYESAIQKNASIREVNILRNFANWLDAQGVSRKIENAHRAGHGFYALADEFLKSLPSQ